MSKKKKYFFSNELSSILESSSDKSVTFSLSTTTDSSATRPIRRIPKPATPGSSLKRINKQTPSNVSCLQELDDRCVIKVPKKKISFSEDSTLSTSSSLPKEKSPTETLKKKSLPAKCKVITVFGKKCPPPPGIKVAKPEEKKPKPRVDFSDKVNFEIDKLASLLKESASNLKKFKKEIVTSSTTTSSATTSKQDEKALVLRPALTVSKFQPIKKDSSKKSLRVKAKPPKIKSPELIHSSKTSSNSSLQSAVDIEIEKLVALLTETKEILGSKLAKKSSMLTSIPKHSPAVESSSTRLSGRITKSSSKISKTSKEDERETLPKKINREIEKIAILLKDPPASIIEKFKSIDRKTSKKSEKSIESSNSKSNDSSSKRKKDILVLKIDLADEKASFQKIKKSSTNKALETACKSPSNLIKEIKQFKQEKEKQKQKEKESLISKMKSQLRDKLDLEKMLATRKQIKTNKEATKLCLSSKLNETSTTTATTSSASKKSKDDKPTLIVSFKECLKSKFEPTKAPSKAPLPLPPPTLALPQPTPKLEIKSIKIKDEYKIKENKDEPKLKLVKLKEDLKLKIKEETRLKIKEESKLKKDDAKLKLKEELKLKEKLLRKIESSLRDENSCKEASKSTSSKRNSKSSEKETSSSNQPEAAVVLPKSNESSKIIISKEPKKINDSFKKVSASARRKILSILNKKVPILPASEVSQQEDLPVLKTESKVIVLKSPVTLATTPPSPVDPNVPVIESPEVIIRQKIKHLGIVETNPDDYMKQFGNCLIQSKDLPKFVLDICPPEGIKLAANMPVKPVELEGDVEALKLVDHEILVREGLSQYKNI